jgi:hypothetical protein
MSGRNSRPHRRFWSVPRRCDRRPLRGRSGLGRGSSCVIGRNSGLRSPRYRVRVLPQGRGAGLTVARSNDPHRLGQFLTLPLLICHHRPRMRRCHLMRREVTMTRPTRPRPERSGGLAPRAWGRSGAGHASLWQASTEVTPMAGAVRVDPGRVGAVSGQGLDGPSNLIGIIASCASDRDDGRVRGRGVTRHLTGPVRTTILGADVTDARVQTG